MTITGDLRIGSLEMLAVLGLVVVVAARPRLAASQELGRLVPVQAVLHIVEMGRERMFEALCPLVIGRDRSATLVLADPEVSRRHARLENQNGVVFVRDLESSNGTFLNGRRIRSAIEVREGDLIDVGTTRIAVEKLQPWT